MPKYVIRHWFKSVPESVDREEPLLEEVPDLNAFAEKNGNFILSPPDKNPFKGYWCIMITDKTGKFNQK